jgi:hypothetical protein
LIFLGLNIKAIDLQVDLGNLVGIFGAPDFTTPPIIPRTRDDATTNRFFRIRIVEQTYTRALRPPVKPDIVDEGVLNSEVDVPEANEG